ncbi:receptor L domain-containing protein [Echinicola rosea]|uniref:Receptor L-domain domain-containing protein n=1 Tax=Echinicola rosea TaxID=1807691 RepID=A0ABQ1UTG6_9BACT|nr:hypothetical protein [Echinicola rosea]GGF26617.1 hypothetical protein GCM10011339_13400 [Echinicola rosea]
MKNYSFLLMLSALAIILFNACQTDLPEADVLKSPVSFGFSLPAGSESSKVASNDFSLVVNARVTITKADGTATEYTNAELELYESDGAFYAEEVFLPLGDYVVTEIYLLDGEGTTLFAIPEAGKLQDYIDQQLPIPFTVERSSTMKTVVLEVLSTLGFTPEEFGFDPEEIVFELADFFKVMLVEKGNPQNILNGTISINKSKTNNLIEIDSVTKVLLKEEYKYDDRSYLKANSPGYLELLTFVGRDSLLQHKEDPLIIELEKLKDFYSFKIGLNAFHVRELQGTMVNSLEEVVKARITIIHNGSELKDYNDVEVSVVEEEGYFFLEAIDLPIGDYAIQELYLQNAEDKTLFAVPFTASYIESYYTYSLPPQFSVSGGAKSHVRFFRVVDTRGFLPSEFNFDPDRISFKEEVLPFYVTLQEKDKPSKHLTGTLISGTNAEIKKEVSYLTRVNLFEGEYYENGDVYIKVQAEGYEEFKFMYPKDSLLKHHEDNPLVFELEVRPLVVEGLYRGNLVLETQAEVDEFSKWHCRAISGNLTIKGRSDAEDQISDLAGLQSLTEVRGVVSISDCDNLSNLNGLENLTSINGRLVIARNTSLQNLKGLSGLTILNEFTISKNASMVNMVGLENLQEVGGMVLESNPMLNALKGLDNVARMKTLWIEDSQSLVNFHGFDTSISSLRTFSSINNRNLESLQGLILPACKIDGGVEITDNWSLESLGGLDFSEHLASSVSLEYNSGLKDISAMIAVKTIGRKLSIETCHRLTSLNGLENLISVGGERNTESLELFDNKKLADFCALTSLFTEGKIFGYDIQLNAYNPTEADMKTGKCILRD